MAVEIFLNLDVIEQQIEADLEEAAVKTLNTIAEDIEPFVPYRTGELSNMVVLDESSLSLEWEAEHAEYVYNMPKDANFNRTVHPKATSQWVDEALQSYKAKWTEDMKRNFSRR